MTLPTNDQKFVMNDVSLNRLQNVEDSLREGGCINIGHKPGGNGYTVTALCQYTMMFKTIRLMVLSEVCNHNQ